MKEQETELYVLYKYLKDPLARAPFIFVAHFQYPPCRFLSLSLLYLNLSLQLISFSLLQLIPNSHHLNSSTFTKEKRARTMVFSSIPAYLDPANWQQVRVSSNLLLHGFFTNKSEKFKDKYSRYFLKSS